ncbi:LuxR C-terminal-related transcriptional regulator [Streptomyces sp. NPDC058632]|uniref:helix-turn-helix transcriptional regulator n=1 Tax=Streptomyces sp. NPDC058632 TaxID=3346567 RepID=UPI003658987C
MQLLERTQDLAPIQHAMNTVWTGGTVLVAVTGTPGMGRSAFLETVADQAERHGFAVRRARGSRLEQGLPLAPGPALPDATGPVALLVDDLHLADAPSLTALTRLLTAPERAPLFLAVAVCEGESATELPHVQDVLAAAHRVIRVGPLGTEGVRALLEGRGLALADDQVHAWTRATGGSPALITSLLDRLEGTDHGTPTRLLDVARARPAPWSLRTRVAAALTGHPESVGRLAGCAAILGGESETHVLARLADLDPVEGIAAARALVRLGWAADRWTPPVLWDCVREIAEDGLSLADRERLHRRAAELLHEAGAPAEQVVPHFLEVGPGDWTGAARVMRETACEVWRGGDDALAIRCLRRALREFPPDSPQRGDLLTALADVEQGADTAAMLRHVGQALPLLGAVRERAAVVACVPLTLFLSAPHAAAEMLGQAAGAAGSVRDGYVHVDEVGTVPHTGPAACSAPAAPVAPAPAAVPVASEAGLRLEARARLARLGDPGAQAAAVERLRGLGVGVRAGTVPGPRADPGTAARRELVAVLVFAGVLGGRLPATEVAGLTRWLLEHEPASAASEYTAAALTIACAAVSETGEPAHSWLDMALETARRRDDQRLRTAVLSWRALTAVHAGRPADAWTDARDACAAAPDSLGDHDWLTVLALTSVAVETDDAWLAARLRDRLAQGQGAGEPVCGLALRVLQIPLTAERELPALVADLQGAVHRAEAAGWHNRALFPVDLWCVPLLLRLGEPEAALELLARACDRARRFGAPGALGRILRMWGTVVRGRYALSLLAESVAVLREGSNRLELGRSLTAYGNRMRAAGRPGSAEILAEADRIAEATGAAVLRCWTGPRPPSPHEARPCGGAPPSGMLSDTERRVASLVALGHTNQDTAEALGVTRRAVEKILTRLYHRLDVDGRAGLIPAVHRMAGRSAFGSGVLADRL